MNDPYNPYSALDKQRVIGTFRATGSHDPDVLDARKERLMSVVGFPKPAGTFLIGLGAVTSLTVIGAIVGIPMVVAGVWLRRRGVRNIASVQAGFEEYADSSRG